MNHTAVGRLARGIIDDLVRSHRTGSCLQRWHRVTHKSEAVNDRPGLRHAPAFAQLFCLKGQLTGATTPPGAAFDGIRVIGRTGDVMSIPLKDIPLGWLTVDIQPDGWPIPLLEDVAAVLEAVVPQLAVSSGRPSAEEKNPPGVLILI